ncbi:MAG: outer membrane beta-barrel protein [Caulobacterales bacterium]
MSSFGWRMALPVAQPKTEGISMKKAFIYASAAVALLAPAAAFAEEGWYGTLGGGYSWHGSLDVDSPSDVGALPSSDRDLDDDWMGFGGIGYGFGNGWRLEGEYAYRDNDLDDGGLYSAGATAQTLMANLLYDFNMGAIKPYVGLGLGALKVDAGELGVTAAPLAAGFTTDDVALGAQGLVGVGFQVNPQLVFDIGYRYLTNVTDLSFHARNDVGLVPVAGKYDADYSHGAVTAALRWQFAAPAAAAAPPPPPPPPPPPVVEPVAQSCPTAQFVVYFEFNKSNLTPEASAVLDRAVSDAAKCNYSSVKVSGNTDLSGSPQYNEGLSASRAQVVADGLTARGVGASLISTEALGESKPAVATPDGVKEPLNRRTEVVITFQ